LTNIVNGNQRHWGVYAIDRTLPRILRWAIWTAFLAAAGAGNSALAQLRIVTYNTTGAPDAGMNIVLKSIGEELRNGIAKPIDVLLLQEQSNPSPGANSPSADTQAFVTLLNNTIYSGQLFNGQPITYSLGTRTGTGDTTQTIVYRTQTVQLLSETTVGTSGGNPLQPRQTLRHRVKSVGYDDTAAFYIYNSHYKASQDAPPSTTNQDRRNVEAVAIRNNSNALGEGAHAIYAGDHNFYTAAEPAFQTLIAAGNGQAVDPLGLTAIDPDLDIKGHGEWNTNAAVAYAHTQSPCTSGCGATGGMDDRFDFQLMTGEFLDTEGLDYISGSYHSFGNNGTTYNSSINNASNTITFPGVTSYTKTQILNALATVTDHIPVVADYQLPAVLNAVASMVPATLNIGQVFNLDVTVSNAANVLQPIGADELDYSVTTSGDLLGSFFNQVDAALGSANVHPIGLSTATPGMKSGIITVASASQAVQNGLIQIPISYQVLAAMLDGDFNDDDTVDAADYTVWRDGFGSLYDENDYLDWKNNFGQSLGSGGGAAAAVPEPSVGLLLVVGVCWLAFRPVTLRAWNRRK
jgi:hypothetical protein